MSFHSPAALDWLDFISKLNAILSAILAVIHPKLYDAGWLAIEWLRNTPEIGSQDILSQWASIFSGVSSISNCITPPHQDESLKKHWYDMLATLGSY